MTAASWPSESRPRADRARLIAGTGIALTIGSVLVELGQIPLGYQVPFVAFLVTLLVGLVLAWHGCNALRQDFGVRVIASVLAVVILAVITVPFIAVVVLGAFQRRVDLLSGPHLLPPEPTLMNLDQLLRIPYFEEGLRNSLLVSSIAALSTTLLGILGAYVIARIRFPGRGAVLGAVTLAYMLPGIALLVPLVAIFRGIGLVDTLPGMVFGHAAIIVPIVIWILVGAFEGIDADVEHAARVDGASRAEALRRVVLPLTLPSVVTTAVFAFVLSWNDLLISKVLYISSTPMLAPAIVNLMDPINRVEPQLSMAGLIASIPVLGLALLMQRYLIRGIGEGAIR
ncbi:MAG: carbohydrate ABC transporter permease [Chloroflexi bacterium]|nr:carbohydrate ABC transporter permease [Chloroflexota bacterium]